MRSGDQCSDWCGPSPRATLSIIFQPSLAIQSRAAGRFHGILPRMYDEETSDEQFFALSLRNPRGHYDAKRTAQLSGIPRPTLYEWRRNEVFSGDYPRSSPQIWSYRDLVLLRLLAWLRQGKMERYLAADKIENIRSHLSEAVEIRRVYATRRDVILDGPKSSGVRDDRRNILPFTDFANLLRTFNLEEPVNELRRSGSVHLWAPDLIRPSLWTRIIPWVLAGEPCIRSSRVPTSTVFALHIERKLETKAIAELYPGLSRESIADSIGLEMRLRGLQPSTDLVAIQNPT